MNSCRFDTHAYFRNLSQFLSLSFFLSFSLLPPPMLTRKDYCCFLRFFSNKSLLCCRCTKESGQKVVLWSTQSLCDVCARVYIGRVRKRDKRRQKTRERVLFVNTEEARTIE